MTDQQLPELSPERRRISAEQEMAAWRRSIELGELKPLRSTSRQRLVLCARVCAGARPPYATMTAEEVAALAGRLVFATPEMTSRAEVLAALRATRPSAEGDDLVELFNRRRAEQHRLAWEARPAWQRQCLAAWRRTRLCFRAMW